MDQIIPSTISEAVNKLLSDLPIGTRQQIKNSTEEDLINFHFGLGMGIRNEFGLWEKDSPLLSHCKKMSGNPTIDPDSASAFIIKALWDRLQKFPPPKVVQDGITIFNKD